MPNITEFKSPTGETLPIADTTARAEIGVLQQRADDTDHAMTDLDNAVKELQQSGTGGGGLPVVELETTLSVSSSFSEADNAALTAAFESGKPFAIRFDFSNGNIAFTGILGCPVVFSAGPQRQIVIVIATIMLSLMSTDGTTWSASVAM